MKVMSMMAAGAVGMMLFQMPATPPMKMGLWESTSTVKMTMPSMPQMSNMPARTVHTKSCMTPESYQKALGQMQQQRGECTRSNEKWGAKGLSFDLSCKMGNATSTGHFEMSFDSEESGHGSTHMNMAMPQGDASMDSTVSMKWLGSDCGGVSPDKPQVMPQ